MEPPIPPESIQRLLHAQSEIDEHVINAYIACLVRHPRTSPRILFSPTYTVYRPCPDLVRRMFRGSLDRVRWWVLPVCIGPDTGGHWVLIVLDLQAQRIYIYDSLPCNLFSAQAIDKVRAVCVFLYDREKDGDGIDVVWEVTMCTYPESQRGPQCGIYVLKMMERLFLATAVGEEPDLEAICKEASFQDARRFQGLYRRRFAQLLTGGCLYFKSKRAHIAPSEG